MCVPFDFALLHYGRPPCGLLSRFLDSVKFLQTVYTTALLKFNNFAISMNNFWFFNQFLHSHRNIIISIRIMTSSLLNFSKIMKNNKTKAKYPEKYPAIPMDVTSEAVISWPLTSNKNGTIRATTTYWNYIKIQYAKLSQDNLLKILSILNM